MGITALTYQSVFSSADLADDIGEVSNRINEAFINVVTTDTVTATSSITTAMLTVEGELETEGLLVTDYADLEPGVALSLYNLGDRDAANYERLRTYASGNVFYMHPEKSGTGGTRDFVLAGPLGSSFGNIKLTSIGQVLINHGTNYASPNITIGQGYTNIGDPLRPTESKALACGLAGYRWGSVGTVDVDATGTIKSGVGGDIELYNLDTDASNYERGYLRWTSGYLTVGVESAGAGTASGAKYGGGNVADTYLFVGNDFARMVIDDVPVFHSTSTYSYHKVNVFPYVDDSLTMGVYNNNWKTVFARQLRSNDALTLTSNSTIELQDDTNLTGDLDVTGSIYQGNWETDTAGSSWYLDYASNNLIRFNSTGVMTLKGDASYSIGASTNTPDTNWVRDDAGVWATRNGLDPQTLRIYNKFIDASNYSRLSISHNGTDNLILSESLGTGSQDRIRLGGYLSGGSAYRGLLLDTTNGSIEWIYNNAVRFRVDSNTTSVRTALLSPLATGLTSNGSAVKRWSDVYSVDGDFSGTVYTGDIESSSALDLKTNGSNSITLDSRQTVIESSQAPCAKWWRTDSVNEAGYLYSDVGGVGILTEPSFTSSVTGFYLAASSVGMYAGGGKFATGNSSGQLLVEDGTSAAPSLSFRTQTANMGLFKVATSAIGMSCGAYAHYFTRFQYRIGSDMAFEWNSNSTLSSGTWDIKLCRRSAGKLDLIGSSQASMSAYYAYTDASNYNRLTFDASVAGRHQVYAESAGTHATSSDIVRYAGGDPTNTFVEVKNTAISFKVGGNSLMFAVSTGMRIDRVQFPSTDNSLDSGLSTNNWRKMWAREIRSNDSLTLTAATTVETGDTNVTGELDVTGDVVMAANVDFTGLPTSDPLVAGRLWNNSGVATISAG